MPGVFRTHLEAGFCAVLGQVIRCHEPMRCPDHFGAGTVRLMKSFAIVHMTAKRATAPRGWYRRGRFPRLRAIWTVTPGSLPPKCVWVAVCTASTKQAEINLSPHAIFHALLIFDAAVRICLSSRGESGHCNNHTCRRGNKKRSFYLWHVVRHDVLPSRDFNSM